MRVNFSVNQCSVHFVSKGAGPCYQITEVEIRFPTGRFLAKFNVIFWPIGSNDLDDNEWPLFGKFTRLLLKVNIFVLQYNDLRKPSKGKAVFGILLLKQQY